MVYVVTCGGNLDCVDNESRRLHRLLIRAKLTRLVVRIQQIRWQMERVSGQGMGNTKDSAN